MNFMFLVTVVKIVEFSDWTYYILQLFLLLLILFDLFLQRFLFFFSFIE